MSTLSSGDNMVGYDPAAGTLGPPFGGNRGVHPTEEPEARRELTICLGAFAGLERVTMELLSRLEGFSRSAEPTMQHDVKGPDSLPVQSPYGRRLRELSEQIGLLERQVQVQLNLLEL